jgi:putative spermidine/putrescine transport system permease protein
MRSTHATAAALLATPAAVITLLFFAPLALMLWASLVTDTGALTLAHFVRFFADSYYLTALLVTLLTSLLVAAIAIVVSYPVAYRYWRSGRIERSIMLVALLAPFYINIVAKVLGWMVLFEPLGLANGYTVVVLVSVHRCLPFVVLLLASAMMSIDDDLIEAASVCGAKPMRIVRSVILPLTMPGIVASAVVAFSLTLAGFVVPLLLGGVERGRFVPVLMYQSMTVAQNWHFGAAMGVVLLAASLLTMAAGNRMIRALDSGRTLRDDFTQ